MIASTLERTVLNILYLMHHPDYDDGFRQTCEVTKNWYRSIRVTLTGRQLGNFQGPKYIEDDDEIKGFLKDMEEENRAAELQKQRLRAAVMKVNMKLKKGTSSNDHESSNSNEEHGSPGTQASTSETDTYLKTG